MREQRLSSDWSGVPPTRRRRAVPTAHCPLPAAHCPLPTTCCDCAGAVVPCMARDGARSKGGRMADTENMLTLWEGWEEKICVTAAFVTKSSSCPNFPSRTLGQPATLKRGAAGMQFAALLSTLKCYPYLRALIVQLTVLF